MKKQTAVEWLVKELNKMIDFIPMDKWDEIRDIVQQAKEMEQKQIINAYDDASNKICLSCTDFKIGADYYQITYNKEIGKL